MKESYENRYRFYLPRRTYTIIRLDQKAGHTFTRGLNKPFDEKYINAMDAAAESLLCEIQGAQFAYTQSDECSILITDFDSKKTEAWFDGNIQKIVSVAASIFTAVFNHCFNWGKFAYFDARAFIIPDREEVGNYFYWRAKDSFKNCISGYAQYHFSPAQLLRKNTDQKIQMLHEIGVTSISDYHKFGRFITRDEDGPFWNLQDYREPLMKHIPIPGY